VGSKLSLGGPEIAVPDAAEAFALPLQRNLKNQSGA
jgi:hypothetical protein